MLANDHLPITYSTLACKAVVSGLLPYYSIGLVKNCHFWHRGLSDIYLVETQDEQYILRISHHHWRSQSEIDFELELLDFLHQRQIPVAYPLRTQDGLLAIEINAPEGKRYASLFIYAPGSVTVGDLNSVQAHRLGETLAKLHNAGRDFHSQSYRPPLDLNYLLDQPFRAIAPFLNAKPQHRAYLAESIAQIKAQLQDFSQEPPFWGICWGDPHSGNAHFTPDNQITLFDFDQCGYGWRAFDIAKFFQVALSTGVHLKMREAFLEGYQSIQPLSNTEINALQALTQTAHIWAWAISLNQALMNNYCRLDDHYFLHRLEHLKMLRSPEWQLF